MLTVKQTMELTKILMAKGIDDTAAWINSHTEEECLSLLAGDASQMDSAKKTYTMQDLSERDLISFAVEQYHIFGKTDIDQFISKASEICAGMEFNSKQEVLDFIASHNIAEQIHEQRKEREAKFRYNAPYTSKGKHRSGERASRDKFDKIYAPNYFGMKILPVGNSTDLVQCIKPLDEDHCQESKIFADGYEMEEFQFGLQIYTKSTIQEEKNYIAEEVLGVRAYGPVLITYGKEPLPTDKKRELADKIRNLPVPQASAVPITKPLGTLDEIREIIDGSSSKIVDKLTELGITHEVDVSRAIIILHELYPNDIQSQLKYLADNSKVFISKLPTIVPKHTLTHYYEQLVHNWRDFSLT